jgi:site-specific DNA-methyltransferase (adenine-specific)
MRNFENKIICGNCIELLSKVKKPFADLIFADPPFNIGFQYDMYHDKKEKDKYIAWTQDWMTACYSVLKKDGTFYIAIGDEYAANVKVIADELKLTMRNWIIWHYTFGQQTKAKFARAHTHIFYFTKDKKNFTFNDHAVRVPSDRQLIYNDKRANPNGKMPDDVWNEYSRVCGTFKERAGWHPCQMPESLLTRIVAVSSKPRNLVLDPFVGSGTTVVVASKMARKFTGIDISADYVKNTRKRLAQAKKQSRSTSLFFDQTEKAELNRLYIDIGINAKDILASSKLLEIFARQFATRMNNGKDYNEKSVATALMDLAN